MLDESVGRTRPRVRRRLARLVAAMAVAAGIVGTGGPVADVAGAQTGCSDIEIVMARGTWEPQNAAFLLPQVANRIRSGLTGRNVSVYDTVYPAQPSFNTSAPQGVTDLVNHVNQKASQCPNQRYVLLGYSQGGLVVTDALLPPAARAYNNRTPTLSSAATSRIAAVGTYGSMRFTAGESFNAGSPEAGKQSMLPRQRGALNAYADRTIEYCYQGDWVCQNSGSFITHLMYIFDGTAQQAVATFVVNHVR
jgi:pimeloyl-ACP methyl ester carboxylesterase